MEIKLNISCKFCGSALDYTISGDIKKVTFHVETCTRCVDNALRAAWKHIEDKHTETD